jgi:hypothetical protein
MSAVARGIRVGGLRGLRSGNVRVRGSFPISRTFRWAIPCSRIRLARPTISRTIWVRKIAPAPVSCSAFTRGNSSQPLPTQLESTSSTETQAKKRRSRFFTPWPQESPSCSDEPEMHKHRKTEENILLPGIPLFGNSLDDPSGPGNGADSTVDGAWLEFFRPCGCWFERVCLCIVAKGPLRHLPYNKDCEDELDDALPLGETVITCATHGDLAPYACCATGA